MIQIHKQKEPNSLTEHREKNKVGEGKADYDNYPEKDDVRRSLCNEQRGLCCYCLGSIQPRVNSMKIEHFECQDKFPSLQLDYSNMLGACMGNEGQPEKKQHCDTFKGDEPLSFNPTNPYLAIEALIHYEKNGTIRSTNKEIDRDINKILNLNVSELKSARKAAVEGFFKVATKKYKGDIKKDTLERWRNDWSGAAHQDILRPYSPVIVYWLQKKINRA